MPKNTLLILIILGLLAALLLGINIGKNLSLQGQPLQMASTPTPFPPTSPTIPKTVKSGTSTYTDRSCGFTMSYQGSYLEQKSQNGSSTIITDPDNPDQTIITTCQEEIPRPPLPPDKIEDITLDGIPAKLYHDTDSRDGSPRDEVIVTHPTLNYEIIIAGYGTSFNEAVTSFKFLQ